jgi:hypothetical protein
MTKGLLALMAALPVGAAPPAALADDPVFEAAPAARPSDEALVFVRVDQTGGLDRGDFATAYSLEGAQAIAPIEGTTDRGVYRGVTHRLAAGYGVTRWLSVGLEQSIKQQAPGDLQLGMFSPIVRARLDRLGVAVPGLGVYGQGRVRISGRRPDSLIGGVSYEREVGIAQLAGLLGYERTVDGSENGFRGEAGVSLRLGTDWRLAGETWGNLEWTPVGREGSCHFGPSLQRRFGAARIGAHVATGVESRVGMLAVDTVAMMRVAVGF